MSSTTFHTSLNPTKQKYKYMQSRIIQNTKETLSKIKKKHSCFFLSSFPIYYALSVPHTRRVLLSGHFNSLLKYAHILLPLLHIKYYIREVHVIKLIFTLANQKSRHNQGKVNCYRENIN